MSFRLGQLAPGVNYPKAFVLGGRLVRAFADSCESMQARLSKGLGDMVPGHHSTS